MASGDEFFRSLVVALCRTLKLDFAFLGRMDVNEPELIQILAMSIRGEIAENFRYRLSGTPCENVVGKEPCHYLHDIQKHFPDNHMLVKMGIESYIGYPLTGSAGQPLGLLAVMHSRPMTYEEPLRSILQIFSARVAAEIERLNTEDILRESEERFHATFNQAAVGIAHVGIDGRFLRVNQKFCEIAGYTCEELYHCRFQDITHPDDLSSDEESVRRMLAGDIQTYSMEKRYIRQDGYVVWVYLTVSLMRDQQEKSQYFISVIEDISARKQAEAHMRQLASVVEQTADSVVITDRNGTIQYVNPAYVTITGYSQAEAIGKKPNIVKSGMQNSAFYQKLWDSILGGEVFRGIMVNRRKDGELYYEEKTISPVKDEKGDITYFVSTGKDITQRVRAMEALRESEVRLENAQRIARLGNWDWNILTNEIRWSDEVYRIFGLVPKQIDATYEAFLSAVHPDDRDFVIESINRALHEDHPYNLHHRIVLPNGDERIVHEQAEVSLDEYGKAVRMVVTVQDVTEYRLTQERLNYLAHYDILTGLPNRLLLQDRLRQVMLDADRNDRIVAVMFLDLDHFKIINDTLGHEVGDELLKAVAERLKLCIRASDTIARLGGDEFTAIVADVVQIDDVIHVATKIIDSLVPPFDIGGSELFVGISIGITLYPLDDNNPDSLLRNADTAMYRAKELGRNTFQFYTADLNRRSAKRLALETALRYALERDEFLLHFQPQLNLHTGRFIGAEALIRWRHPEMDIVLPLEFIPLAEETGLIVPIGEWALRTACAQAQAWCEAGLSDFRVAVNLSNRQLQNRSLLEMVIKILKETRLAPHHLDLELTESLLMHNRKETLSDMEELHSRGVVFTIDDFGTGYSSLSYLKRFSIDTLKIDRSFVQGIPDDPDDVEITQAIIAMARGLGINVIAEGVETIKQIDFLRTHNCDTIQGYYVSKPAPAERITEMMQRGRWLSTDAATSS